MENKDDNTFYEGFEDKNDLASALEDVQKHSPKNGEKSSSGENTESEHIARNLDSNAVKLKTTSPKTSAKSDGGNYGEDFLDDKPSTFSALIKAILLLLVILAFLGAAAFFSFDWAASALVHSRQELPVPDITKKPVDMALDVLSKSNLAIKKAGEEYEPSLPAGSVIRQLPPAGTVVREGKVVRVWISQGTQNIETPDLTGLPLRNAELLIRQNSLTVGSKETAYSLTVEKGSVISQTPQAGEILGKGDSLNLVISNGEPPSSMRLMPDFRQKKIADVNRWASDANINISLTEDAESLFPNGTVIAQTPAPDAEVAPNANIAITISARPETEGEKTLRIYYELPQGKNDNRVRVVLLDSIGEREILNEVKQPGSKIDLTVPYGGDASFRIYVDGILVREKELKGN